jgi:hypothetical protein
MPWSSRFEALLTKWPVHLAVPNARFAAGGCFPGPREQRGQLGEVQARGLANQGKQELALRLAWGHAKCLGRRLASAGRVLAAAVGRLA